MESNGLSASDIALLGNNGMGNNELIWIFALLLLAGGNGFGFGNRGDYGQFASAASQQEILFGQQFQGLDNKIDKIGGGIADATFSLNNSIKDGDAAILSKVAECCCSTKEAVHAEGEATRAMIQQNKIESLQAQINQLQMAQNIKEAMCGVPKINPYLYGITQNGCNCYNG